jgi:hypothetical protein
VRLYRGSRTLIRLLHQELRKAGLGTEGESGGGGSGGSGDSTTGGNGGGVKMSVDTFAPFDQRHHYGGVAAVEEAIRLCKATFLCTACTATCTLY